MFLTATGAFPWVKDMSLKTIYTSFNQLKVTTKLPYLKSKHVVPPGPSKSSTVQSMSCVRPHVPELAPASYRGLDTSQHQWSGQG